MQQIQENKKLTKGLNATNTCTILHIKILFSFRHKDLFFVRDSDMMWRAGRGRGL